ncbi:hypothetical protein V441_10960 [Pseudomonas aeruginosa DHS29]|nr:hypothetical protein V441_10960 [Pseudomonas aeruginosa DHS29]KUI87219.1 hypothetical protein ASV59_22400 [Pseudomonas aeruginosa 0C2E]
MAAHILSRFKYLERSLGAKCKECGVADFHSAFIDLKLSLTDAKHHLRPLLTRSGEIASRREDVVRVDQTTSSNVSDSVSQFHLIAARA